MNRDDRPTTDGRSALRQIADAHTTAVTPMALWFGEASQLDCGTDTCVNSGVTGFDSPRELSR